MACHFYLSVYVYSVDQLTELDVKLHHIFMIYCLYLVFFLICVRGAVSDSGVVHRGDSMDPWT